MRTNALIILVIIGAELFGYFVPLSQLPSALANWLVHLQVGRLAVLQAIVVPYPILGRLMDQLAVRTGS